jgi:hypothetical protein
MAQAPTTWIPTGSPENFAATRERGFTLTGTFEGRRRTGSDAGAGLRLHRMRAAAGVPA